MGLKRKFAHCILIAAFCFLPARAKDAPKGRTSSASRKARVPIAALWHQVNVDSLDLRFGPGGQAHQPSGKFTFIKEDKEGGSPKIEIVDSQGVRWKAKLGSETKSETAASHLVWASGYYSDEDYYLAEVHVAKMPKLSRGREFVSAGGVLHGVRLERKISGQKKIGNWSWFKNPFVGTKELNGLKIMMALINNWDLKEVNNSIYSEKGQGSHYVVSDLGASFGETGNVLTRSKSNPEDYRESKFIQKVTAKYVDFSFHSRPLAVAVVDLPYYKERTRMQDIVKEIPLADARWFSKVLQALSDAQIRDCFSSAGYTPEDVAIYTDEVRQRIKDLALL